LTDPRCVANFRLADWDLLVRQGRRNNLLGRTQHLIAAAGQLGAVPDQVMLHLDEARVRAEKQRAAVCYELERIHQALAPLEVPICLLKGAAYVAASLSPAAGRVFSDIDLLVPFDALAEVENALLQHGWRSELTDPYDQRYYRQWMHELPPLRHHTRLSVLDVHHAILPRTARIFPDPGLLWERARPIAGDPRFWILQPEDLVLHSAAHLFLGEFDSPLRDLADIDALLREFAATPEWAARLTTRGAQLGLSHCLADALSFCAAVFGNPLHSPAGTVATRQNHRRALNAMFHQALHRQHGAARGSDVSLTGTILYIRAHWLRMPFGLLARHLATKSVKRLFGADPRSEI
jgi:hypothetical protein